MRVKSLLRLLVAILSTTWLMGCYGTLSLQKRFHDFEELSQHPSDTWDVERRAEFNQKYIEWFSLSPSTSAANHLDNDDVELLYQAAGMVTFYASLDHVEDQRRWLDELVRRGLATSSHQEQMYESYVRARRFNEARTLSQENPEIDFDPIPRIDDMLGTRASTRTVLALSESFEGLIRRPTTQLDKGILVVFNPSCHFSQNAVTAIQVDPDLIRLFDKNTQWVQPPDGRLGFDSFRKWVSEHPWKKVGIAWRTDEWKEFDLSATPKFYFIDNGQIVEVVTGWPEKGRKLELLEAAGRAGLLK